MRPATTFWQLNILHIGLRCTMQHHNLGLGTDINCNHPICVGIGYGSMVYQHSIVVIDGYLRPAISLLQLDILHIGLRWMTQYDNLGLGTW